MPARPGPGRTGRSSPGCVPAHARRAAAAAGLPRRRAGRPGRIRARARDRATRARAPARPPRPPTRAHRRAIAAPSSGASRRSPSYLSACSARRVTPVNGAHHSSWSSGGGMSAGSPIGTPGAASSRTSSAGRHSPHRAAPSRRQPGALRRQGEVEGACRHRAEHVAERRARRSIPATMTRGAHRATYAADHPRLRAVRHSGTIAIRRLRAVTHSVGLAATSATTRTISAGPLPALVGELPRDERERRPDGQAHRERDRQERRLGRAGLRDDQREEVLPRRRRERDAHQRARRRRPPRPPPPPSSAGPTPGTRRQGSARP